MKHFAFKLHYSNIESSCYSCLSVFNGALGTPNILYPVILKHSLTLAVDNTLLPTHLAKNNGGYKRS